MSYIIYHIYIYIYIYRIAATRVPARGGPGANSGGSVGLPTSY